MKLVRMALLALASSIAVLLLSSCSHSGGASSPGLALGATSDGAQAALASETICVYGSTMAAIHTDGSVSITSYTFGSVPDSAGKYPQIFAPPYKVPGITSAVSLTGSFPITVKTSDGSFWASGYTPPPSAYSGIAQTTAPTKIPFSPGANVDSFVEGYRDNGIVWTLSNGTVREGDETAVPSSKPGKPLDGVVKITAHMAGDGGSQNIYMLRSDGSVWVDASQMAGPVTMTDQNCALPIKGLDHVADLDVCGPYASTPTGAALRTDGSIVYWGIPSVSDTDTNQSPINAPELRTLEGRSKFVKVAAGNGVIAAIDTSGNVWVCGGFQRQSEELLSLRGKDTPAASDDELYKPYMMPDIKNAVDIQLSTDSDNFALALCKDGTAWAWGDRLTPKKIFDDVKLPQ